MNTKLIGSAKTLDALMELIMKRWGWNDVGISEDGEVQGPNGIIDGLRVVKLRNRYRLEMETV